MELSLLVAVGVAALLVSLAYFFLSSSSSTRSGAMTAAASPNASASSSYTGRPLVDPSLRQKHGLAVGEDRAWSVSEVARHCHPHDLWLIVDGKVYDVSEFVDEHPGGVDALLKRPGQDNTDGFHGPQHPEKVHQLIGEFYIGTVQPQAAGEGGGGGGAGRAAPATANGAEVGAVAGDGGKGEESVATGTPAASEGGLSSSKKRRSRKE